MSNGKRVRFARDAAEPKYQLPATDLEALRCEVFSEEQQQSVKPLGSVKPKVPQAKKVFISKAAYSDEPNQQ